ncbi:uncharacterized protein LOC119669796 [Teleopsis dalmanni]|uniref:uncharacterized protein LOC119669796 n=1 Tax=Teleopsis dalmanni TaxID=139649 RepID=UPI0018CF4DF9|nr:uncharacterized protein LOC119669796 [Teleopsis dalmanni]
MQKRRIKTSSILDKLHRGFVYTCIGVTLIGTYALGERVYRYFTVVRPQRKQEELKMIEGDMQDKAPALKY